MKFGKAKLKLGDRARDTITGLTGIIVCVSHWLNGCVRVVIQPEEHKDGKPVDSSCFDIEQIERVDKAAKPILSPSGGPMPTASRQSDPTR